MSDKLYLYAIADANERLESLGVEPVGIGDAPVSVVETDGLALVVSPAPGGKLRPDRRSLAGHQRVVGALAERITVLPVAFGMVTRRDQAGLLLVEHGDELRAELDRVRGRVEMSLRISWDVENVFAYLVERSAELRAARDRVASGASHDARLEIGKLVERTLEAARREVWDRAWGTLESVCEAQSPAALRDEKQAVNVALLVARGRVGEFETAVNQAASLFDDRHRFEYSGPWPAYSFVNVRLDATGLKARAA